MVNDADSHELLSVVAAVSHQGVGKTLNDGAVGLAETLNGVAASGVRHVNGVADLDVVAANRKAHWLAIMRLSSYVCKCSQRLFRSPPS